MSTVITSENETLRDLESLIRGFFAQYGGKLEKDGDVMVVRELLARLSQWFGVPNGVLRLRLPGQALDEDDVELVALGSRVFDLIQKFLSDKGQYTVLTLAERHPAPTKINDLVKLSGIRANVYHSRSISTWDLAYRFNFRVGFSSDERIDELYSVVVDAQGRLRPDLLDVHLDPVIVPVTWNVSQRGITRALKTAVNAVTDYANRRGMEIELDVQPRLLRIVGNLISYYDTEIQEATNENDDKAAIAIAELERERRRRVVEEMQRHSMVVTVDLVSHAMLRIPMNEYFVEVTKESPRNGLLGRVPADHPNQEIPLWVTGKTSVLFDLHSGQVHLPICRVCKRPTDKLALCQTGHVTCPTCCSTCSVCGDDQCTACGMTTCAICGDDVKLCRSCQGVCASCRRSVCPSHLVRCESCGEMVCPECLLTCPVCGRVECRSHGGRCDVCGQDVCSRCIDHCAERHSICQSPISKHPTNGQHDCIDGLEGERQ